MWKIDCRSVPETRFVLAGILAVSLATVPTRAQQPLSLEDAFQILLQENPGIAAATAEKSSADAAHQAATRGRLPAVRFEERFTRGNNPVFVFGSLLEQNRFGAQNFALDRLNDPSSISNFRTSVGLQLPILARREISSKIRSAEAGKAMAESGVRLSEQQLLFQLVSAYFGVELAEAAIEVTRLSLGSARAEVARIQNLVDEGLAVKSDLLAMKVQESEFQQRIVQAETDLETAWAGLATVLGRYPGERFQLSTRMAARDFPIPDQPQLLERALQNRPELMIARARADQAEQELRRIQGRRLPTLNVFAEVGNSSWNLNSGSSDYAVGGSLNFDLFEPGRSERIRQARAGWDASSARLQSEIQQVRLQVVQALGALQSAQQRVALAEESVGLAEENLRIVSERLRAGLTTVTESLRSQTALQNARLNVLASRFESYLGFARVRLASGELVDVAPFTR